MRNSENRHDWRYEPAEPAFAEARHASNDEPGSLLSVAGNAMRDDAAARHRLARMAREAEEADRPALPDDLEEPIAGGAAMANENRTEFLPDNDAPAQPRAVLPGTQRPAAGGIALSKRLIATCGILGTMAGGLTALSLPARYDATAELRLAAGGSAATFAGMDDQFRVLTSGIVLNKVVDKLGLADDPAFNGSAAAGSFLSLARSLLLRNDGGAASDAGHRHTMAASHLADSLSVARGSGASTIAITSSTGNGETSALIANTVAETFLSTTAAIHAEPQDGGAAGVADHAAQRLEVFLAQHGLASGDPTAAAAALLKLDDQLSAARARSADLNGKIAAMRTTSVDAAVGGGLPQQFESGATATLRAQYLAIKGESDRATARLGPRNPERIALDTQLAGARERISAELRRIVASLQDELKQAMQTEQALASRLAQAKLGAEEIATLRTLSQAARQAAARVEPGRNENAVEAADSAGIITKAYAPLDPSGPPRLPITLAGLLLGLAAGFGIGAVRDNRQSGRSGQTTAAGPIAGWDDGAAVPAPDTEALISAVRRALPARDPIDAGGAEPIPTETAETPYPLEDAMYPVYADQMSPFAPQQPGDCPLQQFQPPAYAPPQPYGAQPAMAQAMPQGAYVYAPYAPAYMWQAQPPMPAGFYPYPQPPQRMQAYPQPALPQPPSREASQAVDQVSLEEIRASLREFREAVRDLAESHSRRRFF